MSQRDDAGSGREEDSARLKKENDALRHENETLKRNIEKIEREKREIEEKLERVRKEYEEYKTRPPETVGVKNGKPYFIKQPTDRSQTKKKPGAKPAINLRIERCPMS
ncbi:MAG: hypothetical protein AB1665_02955 [Candidatus Thermoplasmatota archaeon]